MVRTNILSPCFVPGSGPYLYVLIVNRSPRIFGKMTRAIPLMVHRGLESYLSQVGLVLRLHWSRPFSPPQYLHHNVLLLSPRRSHRPRRGCGLCRPRRHPRCQFGRPTLAPRLERRWIREHEGHYNGRKHRQQAGQTPQRSPWSLELLPRGLLHHHRSQRLPPVVQRG